MFNAQILMVGVGESVSIYGPWMSREGDNVTCIGDVVAITGSGWLSVHLFHKAAEDAGDGTDVNGGITISASAVGRTTATEWSGLKDLVRYRFTLTSGGEEPSSLLFRMLPPSWFDSVKV